MRRIEKMQPHSTITSRMSKIHRWCILFFTSKEIGTNIRPFERHCSEAENEHKRKENKFRAKKDDNIIYIET